MKILTFNINSKPDQDPKSKYQALAQLILQQGLELVCLQEVCQDLSSFEQINPSNVIYQIMDYLPSEYQFVWSPTHIAYDQYMEGIAIITNLKFSNVREEFISKSHDYNFWKTRKAIFIDLVDEAISVCCTHTGWYDDKQEPFSTQFRKIMYHLGTKNHLIVGDLNILAGSCEEQANLNKWNLIDYSQFGYSFDQAIDGWQNQKKGKVDYIIGNKPYQIIQQKLYLAKDYLSDHNGFYIEIK